VLEETQGLHLEAKFHLIVFIVLASGGQNPQLWANFDIWELLYQPPFTDKGQIWRARADSRSTLTRKISSECVHCVSFRWPKTKILTFWGLLYRPPVTDRGQIWCARADPCCMLTCQISPRSVCLAKNPKFCHFLNFGICGVASWRQSETVEHGAQLHREP